MWLSMNDDNMYLSIRELRAILDEYTSAGNMDIHGLDLFLKEAEFHAHAHQVIPVWYIVCETGCSCCSYRNYNIGYWTDVEEPKQLIAKWLRGEGNPLKSQYYPYGQYALVETQAEILPDGRVIIDDTLNDEYILTGGTVFK